jgi:predicted PurR-regulated permease PerM
MFKDKINFKLINLAIVAITVYLVYQTGNLWTGVISKIFSIITPFLFGFGIAYGLHPFVKFMESKKIKKNYAIAIVICIILFVFGLTFYFIIPLLLSQVGSLLTNISDTMSDLSTNHNIDFGNMQNTLNTTFDEITKNAGEYVSTGAANVINISIGVIANVFIAIASGIYFLIDMDKIRAGIKKYFRTKSNKTYEYIQLLDTQMQAYVMGFIKIVVITFFEYSFVFTLIGHPNAILLGVLAALANLIPYFGGISINIVAAITAFAISPALFFRTCIVFIILSSVDGYLINPYVYGKSNQIHPLVTILAVYAGSALFGTIGLVMSLPVTIIILATLKFYEKEINNRISKIKAK